MIVFPIGDASLRTLERRFPPLASCPASEPRDIAGILLLGGSMGSVSVDGRIEEDLQDGADRIRLAAALARAHPQALMLVSGGQTFARQGVRSEAEATADLLGELGVSRERLVLETASRTTAENALLAATHAGRARGRWLLVTSAFHMPRAVGTFRKAGLDVIAAPTDWQVDERSRLLSFSVSDRLHKLDLAAKEYLGLLIYWLTGKTGDLLPGPNGAEACA
ncbi:YdcF family protein [Terricaulis silvestris]|uniref:YdcF family protein n=1 Tax=Terricaulis silvestris TaxID=2686094 RepID=UPI00131EC53B|nr:YdcF family protein [Terricaulis silvestris]